MTLKTKMSLLLFLTSISIVSIGFSSWSITAETTAELNGNIKVDNVSDSKEFIKLDTSKGDVIDPSNNLHSGIDTLDYCKTSFINSYGMASDTGKISTYYIIDQSKCKNLFIGCDSLKITLTIKYIDTIDPTYNIFDTYLDSNGKELSSFNHSVTCGKTPSSSNPYNIKNKQYSVDFTFENLLKNYDATKELSDLSFVVNYSVFSKTGEYFTENIYSLLELDKMQFTVIVALSAY